MPSESTDPDRKLDARELEGEPFSRIMSELDALSEGETFLLVNSFEPEPLYDVLERKGFRFESESKAGSEWHVYIERDDE